MSTFCWAGGNKEAERGGESPQQLAAQGPAPPSPLRHCACLQTIAREVVHMRQTIGKLAVNKANMISLSAQMTEQLGGRAQDRGSLEQGPCSLLSSAVRCWLPAGVL